MLWLHSHLFYDGVHAWWGCGHDLIHISDRQGEHEQSRRPEEDGGTTTTQQDAANS